MILVYIQNPIAPENIQTPQDIIPGDHVSVARGQWYQEKGGNE